MSNSPETTYPEAVRTRKGEVEEELSDNVLPATSSCRCVPHSCIKDGGLTSRKSSYHRSVCIGLRAFLFYRTDMLLLFLIRLLVPDSRSAFSRVTELIKCDPQTSSVTEKTKWKKNTEGHRRPEDHVCRQLQAEDQ